MIDFPFIEIYSKSLPFILAADPVLNMLGLIVVIVVVLMVMFLAYWFIKKKPGLDSPFENSAINILDAIDGSEKVEAFEELTIDPELQDRPRELLEKLRISRSIENLARYEAARIVQEMRRIANDPQQDLKGSEVWLLAGPGIPGAVTMAIARHLDGFRVRATVQFMSYADKLSPEAKQEFEILQAAKIRLIETPHPKPFVNVGYLAYGVDLELLAEPRKDAMQNVLALAEQTGIPIHRLNSFEEQYALPVPTENDLQIHVPDKALTQEEVRLLDSLAQQFYKMPGQVLMENAGYWAARESYLLAEHLAKEKKKSVPEITIVCGKGNNGGDGMVIARHLLHWGFRPNMFLLGVKAKTTEDTKSNLMLLESENIKVWPIFDESQLPRLQEALNESDLIIDAILGTGMSGNVRGSAARVIPMMNEARKNGAKILAVDCPSGLDCNEGTPLGQCVEADVTVTFAGSKIGFSLNQGPALCGRLVLADIGLPRELYRRKDLELPDYEDFGLGELQEDEEEAAADIVLE